MVVDRSKINILIACEESQRECISFREQGFSAFSCDIQECSGGHPEWHIHQDVIPLLDGNCSFFTGDGKQHEIEGEWDLIIAHPPCQHLAVSGARWFCSKRGTGVQREAIKFFMSFFCAKSKYVAVENPTNIIQGDYVKKWYPDLCEKYDIPVKPSISIQPYEHGDRARKKTNIWLANCKLPHLLPTDIVDPGEILPGGFSAGASANFAKKCGKILAWDDPETAKIRSKSFWGISRAMAKQWGDYIAEEKEKQQ